MLYTSKGTGVPPDLDEIAFLAAYDPSRYPRPSVTVDVVLLTVRDGLLSVLLGRRDDPPDRAKWALPGGFVRIDEALDGAAERVLREKARLRGVFTEQLFTFGRPDRDPRTRVISVAYYALVEPARLDAGVRSFASDRLRIASVEVDGVRGSAIAYADDRSGLDLAFDHAEIIASAVLRVRGKLDYAPIGFELLPSAFSLRDLRLVHEAILGRPRNKDSFRRTMLDRGLITPTGRRASGVGHRPPELYKVAGGTGR
jgi:8-oxo-dGTP diphosphatase